MAELGNRKIKIIGSLLAVFLFGTVLGFWAGFEFCRETIVINQPFSDLPDQAENYVGTYKVARVIDGDTIEIEGGERVRYIGIDTPEMVLEGKPEECGAEKALEKNRELVVGKTVELSKDVSEQDKYGRLLRYVWVDGILVNAQLVRLGLAKAASFPPDVRFLEEITIAQKEAQKNKAGLWSDCWQK